MPLLRQSGSDFTSFVKAAAQYVPAGAAAKPSKSGGVVVAKPGLGAVVRTSQVGALASPTTSAVVINGITAPAAAPAAPSRIPVTTTFTYSGALEQFIAPSGATTATVFMWGAGGGANTSGGTNTGGAGAYLTGTFAITAGVTYYILVGQGGRGTLSFGGGGNGQSGGGLCGGGGRSAIQRLTPTLTAVTGSVGGLVTYTTAAAHGLVANQAVTIAGITTTIAYNGSYIVAGTPTTTTFTVTSATTGTATFSSPTVYADIVCVGGGGGSASWGAKTGGTGAWTGTARNGTCASAPDTFGYGASQSAGGAAGGGTGGDAGRVLLGGTSGAANCGGGGGGYYGGGSGGSTSFNPGGGGGGSSYTALLTNASGENGVGGPTPPGTTIAGYVTGVAAGSIGSGVGGNGLVIISA